MRLFFLVFLFFLGTAIGSFVCCQARREKLSEKKRKKIGKRSVCLECGYQLRWFDNIPVVSWILLKGKCRKCGKKIGVLEILSEILMGMAFLILGIFSGDFLRFSGVSWAIFIFELIFISILGYLAIYDGKWGELPVRGLTFSIICAIIILILRQWSLFLSGHSFQPILDDLLSTLLGVGILSGIYYLIYFFSKEKMVGGGDWILGLALSLVLGNWWLSLLTLTISNILASVVMVPRAKKNKKVKIYFGPWMILGFFIVFILQNYWLSFLVF